MKSPKHQNKQVSKTDGSNSQSKPNSKSPIKGEGNHVIKKTFKPKSQSKDKKGDKSQFNSQQKPTKKDYKSSKPNYDLVEHLKKEWNKVRVKNMTPNDRHLLLKKMVEKLKGKILQITLRHDVSRIIQSILQFGNNDLRSLVLSEISNKILDISKTPYGHFTILKAIGYCNTLKDQKMIVTALSHHFVSLGTNVIGARIVESILTLYPSKLTKPLKAEFYGKNFRILLDECPSTLQSLTTSLPQKIQPLIDHMRDLCYKFIEKGLLEFTYVHQLLYEYCLELHIQQKITKIDDLVSQLSETLPKLITTKSGVKLICLLITYAQAKDRKRMMKCLKGKVLESLLHTSGHLGVIRLIQITDDVINIQKMILNEIKILQPDIKYSASGDVIGTPLPPLITLAKSPYGYKALIALISSNYLKYFEPDEHNLFTLISPTSKKSDIMRRKEHITNMKSVILTLCHQYLSDLVRDRYGSKFLYEVIRVFYPYEILSSLAGYYCDIPIQFNSDTLQGLEDGDVAADDYDNDDVAADDEEEEEEEGNDQRGEEEEEEEDMNDEYEDDDGDNNDNGEEDEAEYDEQEEGENEDADGNDVDMDMDMDEYEVLGDEYNDEEISPIDNKKKNNKKSKKSGDDDPLSDANKESVLLPIQEDPVAHILIKKIINLELSYESTIAKTNTSTSNNSKASNTDAGENNIDTVEIDTSMWELDPSVATSYFSSTLLTSLQKENKVTTWINCNRPCFVLSMICTLPSLQFEIKKILKQNKMVFKLIQDVSSQHQGGKVLLENLNKL